VLFFGAFLHFAQRVSGLVGPLFRGSKPPLGAGCFGISKGNLAVGNFNAETVQVFGAKSVFFQRKRRRDVCKNALAHFSWQRLFKFLRKSIAVGNLNSAFYFTKVEDFFDQKVQNIFYLTVSLVNSFCALFLRAK